MTEEEFYKEKIFNKVAVTQLKRQFPQKKSLITNWYKSERYKTIQDFKSLMADKFNKLKKRGEMINLTNDQFYLLFQWREQAPKKCYYCSLPEFALFELHNQPCHINKRYPQRGKSLEIDRKHPKLPYTDLQNLVLACYWCNNAKTDTFTASEFLIIGQTIKIIWESRLNRKL